MISLHTARDVLYLYVAVMEQEHSEQVSTRMNFKVSVQVSKGTLYILYSTCIYVYTIVSFCSDTIILTTINKCVKHCFSTISIFTAVKTFMLHDYIRNLELYVS